jgi:drug/metabolite transporter (DMT)-like permease
MSTRDWLSLAVLSLLWGGSFLFVELAVAEIAPFALVLMRVSIAALALWVYVLATGGRVPRGGRLWLAFLIMGIFNNVVPFSLIAWGQTQIAAGLASILNATTPLFTVLIAHVWPQGERATALKLAGVGIGIVGVAVLIGPGVLDELPLHTLGELAVLAASVSYAASALFGRRLVAAVPPAMSAAGTLTGSTAVMLVLTAATGTPLLAGASTQAIGSVVALALLSTALAYILYFRVLKSAGATAVTLVTFLIPVSAVILAGLFLGETISARQVAGFALIAVGLACVDGRLVCRLYGRAVAPGTPRA